MQRSDQQNKALHVYLEQIAEDFNDAGYDFKKTVKLPVRFTKENIKTYMFKPIMNSMYPDKESTTELSKMELSYVYEAFNAAISERFGIGRDFPSEDSLKAERRIK